MSHTGHMWSGGKSCSFFGDPVSVLRTLQISTLSKKHILRMDILTYQPESVCLILFYYKIVLPSVLTEGKKKKKKTIGVSFTKRSCQPSRKAELLENYHD